MLLLNIYTHLSNSSQNTLRWSRDNIQKTIRSKTKVQRGFLIHFLIYCNEIWQSLLTDRHPAGANYLLMHTCAAGLYAQTHLGQVIQSHVEDMTCKWSSRTWCSHFCDFIKTAMFVQTALIRAWWNLMKAVCSNVGVLINSPKNENTPCTRLALMKNWILATDGVRCWCDAGFLCLTQQLT